MESSLIKKESLTEGPFLYSDFYWKVVVLFAIQYLIDTI